MKPDIDQILQKKYPDYSELVTDDEKDDFWDNLDNKETYQINKEYLMLIANPSYDYLMCWEPGRFDNNELATDYDDFYTIDYAWWEFQKRASWNSIEEYKKWMEQGSKTWTPEVVAKSINDFHERYKNYSIYMTGDWYRLIDNDTFLYAQLISLNWFIYYKLEIYLDDLEDSHIPYTFKNDDLTNLFNEKDPEKIYDAKGREKELESFKDKMRKYQINELSSIIDSTLSKFTDTLTGKTFRIDTGYDADNFDPFTDFIFFDIQSLKNVSPKEFLKTFKEHQVDASIIEKIIDELKLVIFNDFKRIYNDNYKKFNL